MKVLVSFPSLSTVESAPASCLTGSVGRSSGPLVRGEYAGEPTMAPLKMTLTQSLSVAT